MKKEINIYENYLNIYIIIIKELQKQIIISLILYKKYYNK